MKVTKQSMWDKTWQHHIVEGNPMGKSAKRSPSCAYNRDGKFCAIGCQVHHKTSLKMEKFYDGPVSDGIEKWLDLDVPQEDKEFFEALHSDADLLKFATTLQRYHDGSEDLEDYRKKLEKAKCLI